MPGDLRDETVIGVYQTIDPWPTRRAPPAGPVGPPLRPGSGPLAGTRVVEFAGLGPAPFAAMLLADLGADVVTVDRVPPAGATAAAQRAPAAG